MNLRVTKSSREGSIISPRRKATDPSPSPKRGLGITGKEMLIFESENLMCWREKKLVSNANAFEFDMYS